MKRSALLKAVYFVDQVMGDPECFPHPVRLIGAAITYGETALRRRGQSPNTELALGAALTISVVIASYYFTAKTLRLSCRCSDFLGDATELFIGWTCLAARNLQQEATAVTDALASDDLDLARRRLSRIVGRDTQHLNSSEISRAVIETVAESASDGILAPLFYMTLGGVPLAMAYKAVNTLDSMIGHADSRYLYFGKVAARLDDVANYLPARLTALGIVAASSLNGSTDDAQSAWTIWRRDGNKHKSPNAGQPESAMSGSLQVGLGGDNRYAGELISTDRIGQEFPAPGLPHARRAIRLVSTVSILGLVAGAFVAGLAQSRRSR